MEANALAPAGSAAAADLLAAHRDTLLRRARRFSICADDADDALQRAVEILMRRYSEVDPARVLPWMLTVVGREALAVRKLRQRALECAAAYDDLVERTRSEVPGPHEHLMQRERVARAARLIGLLKPQERHALALRAHGYSYSEIQEITGWTHTKTNRCLAEGRARLRQLGALD